MSEKGMDNKPDRDSLMALQALLTIRTESMTENESSPSSSPPASSELSSTTDVNSSSTTSPDPSSMKSTPESGKSESPSDTSSAKVAAPPAVPGSAPTKMIHPPQHAVGHYATPYILPGSVPVRYGNTPYNQQQHGFHGPVQPQNAVFGGYQFFVPQGSLGSAVMHHPPPQPAAAAVMPKTALPGKPTKSAATPQARSPGGNRKRKKSCSMPKNASKSEPDTSNEMNIDTAEKIVRKEEIEAALRSKPQRGRKRENLSAQERLELTRTRNREHAKSTRIRKKARYQELLEKEKEYDEILKLKNLAVKRRECLRGFLAMRTRMLKALHDPTTNISSPAAAAADSAAVAAPPRSQEEANLQRDTRVVSFADGLSTGDVQPALKVPSQETNSPKPPVEFIADSFVVGDYTSLNEIIEKIDEFRFDRIGASSLGADQATEGILTLAGISAMKRFDLNLLSSVKEQHGNAVLPTLCYRAKSSGDGIAIGNEGIGYAEVELTLQGTDQIERTIKSLIFKLRFDLGSSKLSSVEWGEIDCTTAVTQAADQPNQGDCPSSSSGESSLGCQRSYPSVVSLDQGAPATGQSSGEKAPRKDSEEGNGPGMHI